MVFCLQVSAIDPMYSSGEAGSPPESNRVFPFKLKRDSLSSASVIPDLLGKTPVKQAANLGEEEISPEVYQITEAEKCIHNGRGLLRRGRLKRAIQEFRTATRIAPQFAPGWNDLGVATYKAGHPRMALRHFITALDREPSFIDAAANIVDVYAALQQPANAVAPLQALYERAPYVHQLGEILETLKPIHEAANEAARLTRKGREKVSKGQYEAATLLFIEAATRYPGCVPAWNDLGVTLYRSGNPEAAVEAFERALAVEPGFADSALNLASIFSNAGCPERGIGPLKAALAEDSENEEISVLLSELQELICKRNLAENKILRGREMMKSGNVRGAIVKYKEALDVDDENTIAFNDLGVALWSIGEAEQAIANFSKSLDAHPGFADAAINLATVYASLERHQEAIPTLTEAAGLNPDNQELEELLQSFNPANILQSKVDALVQRGRAYVDDEKLDQAMQCFLAATELDPHCAPAWSDLGVTLATSDKVRSGIESFERALRADPAFIEPALNLAIIYANLEQFENSETILEQALKLNPAHPEILALQETLKQEQKEACSTV